MKKFLTLADMEKICEEINDKHIPDDERFMKAIEYQYAELGDASRDQFVQTAFRRMLSVLDEEVRTIENKVNIESTCKKGCSHCCYFPVILTKMEVKLIAQHIEGLHEQKKGEVLAHLKKYYEHEKLEKVYEIDFKTDRDYKKNYLIQQVACPLLDKEKNQCLTYEVRPVTCRTYQNYSDPQICEETNTPDETFSYGFLYEYYIYALVNTIQEVIINSENDPIELPTDVYESDYLPRLLKELL